MRAIRLLACVTPSTPKTTLSRGRKRFPRSRNLAVRLNEGNLTANKERLMHNHSGYPGAPPDSLVTSRNMPWSHGEPTMPKRPSTPIVAELGSVLYAAAIGDEIKIGYTADVIRRLDHLRSKSGQDCQLLAIRFGTMDDERNLHRSLAAHRSHGREWYRPTPEVRSLIDQWRADLWQSPLE